MDKPSLLRRPYAWLVELTELGLLGLLSGSFAMAEDWPQWRGPRRDGSWNEDGILQSFPTNGLKISWRVPVGFGFSSPVVSHGRVFVSDLKLARPQVVMGVRCLDQASGKLQWSFWDDFKGGSFPDWAFVPGQEPAPHGTPVVDRDCLYVPGPMGQHFYCLSVASGEGVWKKNLAEEYHIDPTTSLSASPLIEGRLVILATGGQPDAGVIALDKRSGKEIWRSVNEATAHSSPILIHSGGRRQLIVWTLQSVTSLDPKSGKVFWKERFVSPSSSVVSTPVFFRDLLLVNGLMFKLDSKEPAARVLWPKSTAATQRFPCSTSTPVLKDGYAYLPESSGKLVCKEIETGKVVWETDQVTSTKGANSCMHFANQGGSELIFNDQGDLIRARLGPEGYHEIGRVKLLEPSYSFSGRKLNWSAPAYSRGHVFARNDREIVSASLEARGKSARTRD